MKFGKSNLVDVLLFISIFLLSLENHGDTRLYFSTAIVIIIYFFYQNLITFKNIIYAFFLFSGTLIILSLFSSLEVLSYRSNMGNYGVDSFFVSNAVKIVLSFLMINILARETGSVGNIIKYLLLAHVFVFYTQLIVVYITGYYIDMLYLFTGEASRYTWGVSIPIIGETFRPTGMYNEPSTYSAFVLCLFLIKFSITQKIDRLDLFTILSFFLSLSFASIFYGLSLLIILNFKGDKIIKYIPLIVISSFILSPLVISMLDERTSGSYDAIGLRLELFNVLFSQSFIEILFGSGPIGVPYELEYLINNPNLSWVKNGLPALNDNGLIVFIFMKFGLIGCISLLIFMRWCLRSNRAFLYNSLILITKIKYTSALFIFYLIFMTLNKKFSSHGKD